MARKVKKLTEEEKQIRSIENFIDTHYKKLFNYFTNFEMEL